MLLYVLEITILGTYALILGLGMTKRAYCGGHCMYAYAALEVFSSEKVKLKASDGQTDRVVVCVRVARRVG